MGAHSSPVYLDVGGRRPFSVEDAAAIGTIIDGARTWVETIAAVRSPAERARLAEYFTSTPRRRSTRSTGSARRTDAQTIVRTFSNGWPSASGPIVE